MRFVKFNAITLRAMPVLRKDFMQRIACGLTKTWWADRSDDGPERKWPVGVAADQLELTGWQVMVFRNKKVVRKVSQKPAIFVGPLMLHGDGKFATYHHFLCKIRWRRWLGTTWWSMLLTQSLRSSWRTMVRCVLNNAVPVHMMLVQVQA